MELRLPVRGPFSLAAARDFLCGFTPAGGSACAVDGRLVLGFRLDGGFAPIAAALREADGAVVGEAVGRAERAAVEKQLARILSLDGDGEGYAAIGRRDPAIGRVMEALPGLRPVVFASPYEAGAWGLLAARLHMRQAAALKRRLAEERGDVLTVDGASVPIFPSPEQLLAVDRFPGLPDEKLARLRGLAEAALAGRLDAERLRAMPPAQALAELSSLRGVGPWTAGHMLVRGAGTFDELPLGEPRVHRAVALAYGLSKPPTDEEVTRIAEAWRPFRTWVTVLVVAYLGRHGDWNAPDDGAIRRRGSGTRRGRSA